jgi:hypothetical protein
MINAPNLVLSKVNISHNLLSENARLTSLRVPKIHRFIQQFVNNNKVVSDTFFFKLTKVVLEHLQVIMFIPITLSSPDHLRTLLHL